MSWNAEWKEFISMDFYFYIYHEQDVNEKIIQILNKIVKEKLDALDERWFWEIIMG